MTADAGTLTCSANPCDASTAPTNGAVGTCNNSLASGSTCQPTCDSGYTVSGTSSCNAGTLTAATCTKDSSHKDKDNDNDKGKNATLVSDDSGTPSPAPSFLIVLLTTFVCALFL